VIPGRTTVADARDADALLRRIESLEAALRAMTRPTLAIHDQTHCIRCNEPSDEVLCPACAAPEQSRALSPEEIAP
jgi:hypothetical protein